MDSVNVADFLLIMDAVNPNARNNDHNTPLHIESDRDAVGVAGLLLARDEVDSSARNNGQNSPAP